MRHDARRDVNEPEIVRALEAVGATVKRLHWCDLLVGYRGRNYLIEVKTPDGRLTVEQKAIEQEWRGQYTIARTVNDALQTIGAIA